MVSSNSNNNTVELLGWYGGDLTHAVSAWTSTTRDLSDEKRQRIPKLLEFLASNGHHTPFEKSSIHFLVTVDTATHIQLLKHRIGVSINGESARYKELHDDKFYLPTDWQDYDVDLLDRLEAHVREGHKLYHLAVDRLVEAGMERRRAKESARFALPYAHQIQMDVMFNFRSFMHFLGLRWKYDAQLEIHDLGSDMHDALISTTKDFDNSLRAFGYGT